MALVSAGMVMTKATSSTSMTSTSGVMLISLRTSLSSEVDTAMASAPVADDDGLQAVHFLRAPLGAQHGVLREIQEVIGEIIEICGDGFHAAHEEVEGQHRGNRHGDADARGHERLTDRPCHDVDGRIAEAADVLHRRHDSPHRAEEADERRGAADARKHSKAAFERAAFAQHLLAKISLQQFVTVECMLVAAA